jgi:three-Cys-motif partner protein
LPLRKLLPIRLRPDFSVVFEGYAGGAANRPAPRKAHTRSLRADSFAGAGRSRIRAAWDGADDEDLQLLDDEFVRSEEQFIEGSPHRALALEHPFTLYHFFDADAGRAAFLEGLRAEYPDRKISVKIGDANAVIQDLAPRIAGRKTKGVAFLWSSPGFVDTF